LNLNFMSKHSFLHIGRGGLLLSLLLATASAVQAQIITPIRFTGGNANLIYDASQNNGTSGPTVVGMDNNYAAVSSSSGYNGALPADEVVQMQDGNSYQLGALDADSGVRTDLSVSPVVLTISAPAEYSSVGFITTGGDGGGTVDFTLNFANGSEVTGSFNVPDAFSGSASNASDTTYDRVGQLPSGGDTQQLFHFYDFTTGTSTLPASNLVSIDLSETSGHEVAIYAVSGALVSGDAGAVPEPSTVSLFLLGGLALVGRWWMRRRA
jgi:hypothetical protein